MKLRIATVALASAALLATPAAAHKSDQSHNHGNGKAPKCKTHNVAYVASGTLVSHTLAQTQGADTPNKASDDRYSGTLTVQVRKTNKHARRDKGQSREYTLENDRVSFGEGVTLATAVPGTRVKLIGKIARVSGKRCQQPTEPAQPNIRKVVLKAPEAPSGS